MPRSHSKPAQVPGIWSLSAFCKYTTPTSPDPKGGNASQAQRGIFQWRIVVYLRESPPEILGGRKGSTFHQSGSFPLCIVCLCLLSSSTFSGFFFLKERQSFKRSLFPPPVEALWIFDRWQLQGPSSSSWPPSLSALPQQTREATALGWRQAQLGDWDWI